MVDGQVDQAITEYRRFIYFRQNELPDQASHAAGQIALAYRSKRQWDQAVAMHHRAIEAAASIETKELLRIDLALTEILRARYDLADFTLLRVEHSSSTSAVSARASFLLGISSLYQSKWSDAWDAFDRYSENPEADPAVVAALKDLRTRPVRVKSESKARLLSTLIPGLGQLYVGKWREGAGAFLLSTGGALLVVKDAASGRWWDAASDVSSVFLKFYRGNRNGAARLAAATNRNAGRDMVAELMRRFGKPRS